MDDITFCTACGKQLEADTQYCPACGTTVVGSNAAANQNTKTKQASNEKVRLAAIFLFAGALFTLIMGAYFTFDTESLVNMMKEAYESIGYDIETMFQMTLAEIKDYFVLLGYLLLACGVFCLISGVLSFIGRFWIITLISALIATLLGLTTLLGLIFGLLACWYIYTNKDAFES